MSRPLRIAADARVATGPARRGIGKTTLMLYRALAAARPAWSFTLVCRTPPEPGLFADYPNVAVRAVEMPGDRFELWRRVRLPLALAAARPDAVHAPAGLPAWPLTAPLVATLHDLIPIDPGPRNHEAARWGRAVRSAARRAAVVVTPSEYSRGRVVALLGVPASRVNVVPWAPLSTPAAPPGRERRAELAARYGFDPAGRYALHFGMDDPRKNTRHLLAEWRAVADGVRAGVALVVVGVEGPALEEFRALAAPGVSVSGYVDEADARDLLGGASAVVYPTTDEGFGLPLLDAFAAGVPVVAGDRASVPEVAGGAAETVDVLAPGRLAAGLARVLGDASHAAELARRGHERAAQFSWAATAEGYARAFERAA